MMLIFLLAMGLQNFVFKFLVYLILLTPLHTMANEETDFSLLLKDSHFEIREYFPRIIAHVNTQGDFSEASSKGFKLLADFIFGNNSVGDASKKIAMTTPVTMTPSAKKIAMTTPVITQGGNNDWMMSFVMPKEFSLATLPKPNNPDITITQLPKEKFAVIIFSGLIRESSFNEKIEQLNQFIDEKKLNRLGAVQIARYNPPWTLPFFRRNELMVRVE